MQISGKIVEIEYFNENGDLFTQWYVETALGNYPIRIDTDVTIDIPEKQIKSKKEVGDVKWKGQ